MLRIGLTGGIASGKSLVADLLSELGAVVIDADVLAREAVEPGSPGLAEVVERFGPGILSADGTLDRAAVGAVIFSDDDAREDLNRIIHPRVRAATRRLEAGVPDGAVVVHVIPLLVETGQANDFDLLVVVDVPVEVQVRRLIHRNNLTDEQARARLKAQARRTERLEAADVVIDNAGDIAATSRQVQAMWDGIVNRGGRQDSGSQGGHEQMRFRSP